jgi:hypothetical protein
VRLAGLEWGHAYSYFCQGDGIEAYSVAVDYQHGETRAQYIGQPNYNTHSKLPGPLWTVFCAAGLRLGGSIEGAVLGMIILNTAAVGLTWLLARRTLGTHAAIWAALLQASLPSPVYYSTHIYNPGVMPFLGGLFFLCLWQVTQTERSKFISLVCALPLMMLQFHMSGLLMLPVALVAIFLSGKKLNLPWLVAGVLAGFALYVPYILGESANEWQNTRGMFAGGGGGYSWDALKALTTPLNLLISWVPQWSRGSGAFRELGTACFGEFWLFLIFNALCVVATGAAVVGAILIVKNAMHGLRAAPRNAFARSPGPLFLGMVLISAIVFALITGRPFHARYGLVLLPALLALAGGGVAHWLENPGRGKWVRGLVLTAACANLWFMGAMFRFVGREIEHGSVFVPSFSQLETVYQSLKGHVERKQPIEVEVDEYRNSFPVEDEIHRDAWLVRRYVEVREKETKAFEAGGTPMRFVLRRAEDAIAADPGTAYLGHGIALVEARAGTATQPKLK